MSGNEAFDGQSLAPQETVRELLIEQTEDRKDDLRSRYRSARKARSDKDADLAARALAERAMEVAREDALEPGDCVACYVSRTHEPGTGLMLDSLREAGFEVLVPVLGPGLDRGWARYSGPDCLQQRAPGRPLEPSGDALPAQELARARLLIVPALAVDPEGYRLGQGGGWYDRALLHADPGADVMAVVFDEEVSTEPVPRLDHDVRVGGVITPSGWWRITA
ncbi:5-formyltetrahydrofolate cyclo-ligase [Serinibacter salmoneus]|uniref:5-formyltetrahydrofolate cyclo-ligase n=1 Tax=Serinibacter salmoneus TaxID=556530 RepID=A0A2A9D1D6_9MICO|nr:5-formyltetrahydrofolate cyclo-ligase [Serinibacter salmoneus]PFG20497.1 5-formyltetrahydrofolate cyclo-ligase [Serinibacter salmoneus]